MHVTWFSADTIVKIKIIMALISLAINRSSSSAAQSLSKEMAYVGTLVQFSTGQSVTIYLKPNLDKNVFTTKTYLNKTGMKNVTTL